MIRLDLPLLKEPHTTTVNGNGKDPDTKELLVVGKEAGMNMRICKQIIAEIREITVELENKYCNIRS